MIAGVVAFGALVYGGFLWMTSEGEPLKKQKSKSRILSALLGIVLIVSSYIFLGTINPNMIKLEKINIEAINEDIESPGVYLSLDGKFETTSFEKEKEVKYKNIRKITFSERGLGSLSGDKIKAIRIVNPKASETELLFRYVVVVHEKENFQGKCKFFVSNNVAETFQLTDINNIQSITVFQTQRDGTDSYGGVSIYNKPEFQSKPLSEGGGNEGISPQKLNTSPTSGSFYPLSVEAWSIDMDGSYAVILASGSSWDSMNNSCAVFATGKPVVSLIGHYMNKCAPNVISDFFASYRSCATHYAAFPLYKK